MCSRMKYVQERSSPVNVCIQASGALAEQSEAIGEAMGAEAQAILASLVESMRFGEKALRAKRTDACRSKLAEVYGHRARGWVCLNDMADEEGNMRACAAAEGWEAL